MRGIITIAALFMALVLAGLAAASGNHWCKGDPWLLASATTSCPFAGNVVTRYVQAGVPHYWRGRVFSPITRRSYLVKVRRPGAYAIATSTAGAWIRFYAEDFLC